VRESGSQARRNGPIPVRPTGARTLPGAGWLEAPKGARASRLEWVYRDHHQRLYRYCTAILGDPDAAQDALQATMEAALRGLAGERRRIALVPWLYRIARNESLMALRRRSRTPIPLASDPEIRRHGDPRADVAATAEARMRLRALLADLEALPERQRSALVMRELSGLDYGEIAAALECSEGSARQTVHAARASLSGLAAGRALDCDEVRRAISAGDGRRLRSRRLRSHIRSCAACSRFHEAIDRRRADLAVLFPPLSPAAASGVLASVLEGGGAAGSGAAASGAAVLGGGPVLGAATVKTAVAVVATCALAIGGAHVRERAPQSPQGTRAPQTPSTIPVAAERPATADAVAPAGSAAPPTAPGRNRGRDGGFGGIRSSAVAAAAAQAGSSTTAAPVAADGADVTGVDVEDAASVPASSPPDPPLSAHRAATARRLRLLRALPAAARRLVQSRLRGSAALRRRARAWLAAREVSRAAEIPPDRTWARALTSGEWQLLAGRLARRKEADDETTTGVDGDRVRGGRSERRSRNRIRREPGAAPGSDQAREAGLPGRGEGASGPVPGPLRAAARRAAALRAGKARAGREGGPPGEARMPGGGEGEPDQVPRRLWTAPRRAAPLRAGEARSGGEDPPGEAEVPG